MRIDRKLIDKVTLLGLSVSDHPDFKDLMSYLIDEAKVEVSVPSLRVDSLDRDTLRLIAKGGQKVLTIAPESSEKLRRALGKGFSDDDIVNIAINALELGFSHLKLYFMVGLPGVLILYRNHMHMTNSLLIIYWMLRCRHYYRLAIGM